MPPVSNIHSSRQCEWIQQIFISVAWNVSDQIAAFQGYLFSIQLRKSQVRSTYHYLLVFTWPARLLETSKSLRIYRTVKIGSPFFRKASSMWICHIGFSTTTSCVQLHHIFTASKSHKTLLTTYYATNNEYSRSVLGNNYGRGPDRTSIHFLVWKISRLLSIVHESCWNNKLHSW